MCCSFVGQIIFGALMVVALGLTIAAMFTPGWKRLKAVNEQGVDLGKGTAGIMPFFCSFPGENNTATVNSGAKYCREWFNNMNPYEKAVLAAMCAAAVIEIIAVVWTLVSFCACCCKDFISHPLPALATLAAIFLAIAVGLYAAKHKEVLEMPKDTHQVIKSDEVGFSFYLTCGALAAAVIDIIVGSCTLALAKKCL